MLTDHVLEFLYQRYDLEWQIKEIRYYIEARLNKKPLPLDMLSEEQCYITVHQVVFLLILLDLEDSMLHQNLHALKESDTQCT